MLGLLQEGMAADTVILDPESVGEGSDDKAGSNGLPTIGIQHVIVNGRFVKHKNQATGVMAGDQ